MGGPMLRNTFRSNPCTLLKQLPANGEGATVRHSQKIGRRMQDSRDEETTSVLCFANIGIIDGFFFYFLPEDRIVARRLSLVVLFRRSVWLLCSLKRGRQDWYHWLEAWQHYPKVWMRYALFAVGCKGEGSIFRGPDP